MTKGKLDLEIGRGVFLSIVRNVGREVKGEGWKEAEGEVESWVWGSVLRCWECGDGGR